jgi:signal transduction histidine kinase
MMPSALRPVERDVSKSRSGAVTGALLTQWRSLGSVGRLACVGLVLGAAVAVALGLSIQNSVRRHLLEVRAGVLQHIVDEFAAEELVTLGGVGTAEHADVVEAVERRLIGGEVVAVSLRDAAGRLVYGEPSRDTLPATASAVTMPHVEQHDDDGLLHFQLAVTAPDGVAVGSLEAFQRPTSFDELLRRVRRNLWFTIATGLGLLAVAMGTLTLSNARALDGRRRHAEQLLRELLRAEDGERHRIVGSLHDDIGQPLYRVLYGLEGCRARLQEDSLVAAELDKLTALVREVDRILRAELRRLHRPGLDGLELAAALDALVTDSRSELVEVDLDVEIEVDLLHEPSAVARTVLLQAVQESLMNVRRHAAASQVRIRVHEQAGTVVIEVADDGRGIVAAYGLGLTTAAERLEALGGGLRVSAGRTGGTLLQAWVPVEMAAT